MFGSPGARNRIGLASGLAVQRGIGAVARSVNGKLGEIISAKDFGVVADGVTNDTAALQVALTYAKINGGTVVLPVGKILITGTGVIIDETAMTLDNDATRISIVGQGPGSTQILHRGSAAAITYLGGSFPSAGVHAYARFDGFSIFGQGSVGQHGISTDNAAFFSAEDLVINACDTGIVATDSVSYQINACTFRDNKRGVHLSNVGGASGSDPNNISFVDCEFGNNSDCGALVLGGSLVRFIGGAVEGNGFDTGAPIRAGIKIEDAGGQGAVGLLALGVYFEVNSGNADIWIDQTTAERCLHYIAGCSFARISNVNFVTNNIRLDCNTGTDLLADITGCAFKRFNTYVASSARPYIGTTNCLGANWRVRLESNHYHDATEVPAVNGQVLYGTSSPNRDLNSTQLLAASGAAVSVTGTTSLTTLATVTVPADAMGPNGALRITTTWSWTNNANNKTLTIVFGGTNHVGTVATTIGEMRTCTDIINRNATNSQVNGGGNPNSFGFGAGKVTSAADTTIAQNIDFKAQLANAADTVTLESYLVEILRAPL
jgi:hypothetical protein